MLKISVYVCLQLSNYYVAAGMNSTGIALAGGVGKYLAEWIIQGDVNMDFWSVDIRRFVDLHNNKKFLKDRVRETLGKEEPTVFQLCDKNNSLVK